MADMSDVDVLIIGASISGIFSPKFYLDFHPNARLHVTSKDRSKYDIRLLYVSATCRAFIVKATALKLLKRDAIPTKIAENRPLGTLLPLPNQSGSAPDNNIDIVDQIAMPPKPQLNRITGLDRSRYNFDFTLPDHLSRPPPIPKQSFHLNQGGDPIRKRPLDRVED
ncbi:hypothetical protein G7Y89_g13830 [Cudoniella acicularis]|uniref:Uncharacterized protein n=1 Tax=Cudoniella acicularis TaxID=354080 RepID=A0A8H4VVM8_9HELO|nr:hypothetical protein G7Y89_g13830 [Cudoniella acicularis]